MTEEEKQLSRKTILLSRIDKEDEELDSLDDKSTETKDSSSSEDNTKSTNNADILLESLLQSEVIGNQVNSPEKDPLHLNEQELTELCSDLLNDDVREEDLLGSSMPQGSQPMTTPNHPFLNEELITDHFYESFDQNLPQVSENNFVITDLDTGSRNYLDPIFPETPHQQIGREIGFPASEFIDPEKNLIRHLVEACSILAHPYKKIQHYNHYVPIGAYRISQYFFGRLVRVCKQLSGFTERSKRDKTHMLRCNLMELLMIRSVLMFCPDRDGWFFVNVSDWAWLRWCIIWIGQLIFLG